MAGRSIGDRLQLGNLVHDEPVGKLVLAGNGAGFLRRARAAEVETVDHSSRIGAAIERQGKIIERRVEIEHRRHRFLTQKQNSEPEVVWHQPARAQCIDELGRQSDADYGQGSDGCR